MATNGRKGTIVFTEQTVTLSEDGDQALVYTPTAKVGSHLIYLPEAINKIIWDGPDMGPETAIETLEKCHGIWYEGDDGHWAGYIPGFDSTLPSLKRGCQYYVMTGSWPQMWQVLNYVETPDVIPDYLAMMRPELYQHLINGNVARDWWNLPLNEAHGFDSDQVRRELAIRVGNWWSWGYFDRSAKAVDKGGSNCSAKPTYRPGAGGKGMEVACAYRHALLGDLDCSKVPHDMYWYRMHSGEAIDSDRVETPTWKCYEPGVRFSLPAAIAYGGCDYLNCIQIAQDVNQLESWVFFQLDQVDLHPGGHGTLWNLDWTPHAYIMRPGRIKPNGIIDTSDGVGSEFIADIWYNPDDWRR